MFRNLCTSFSLIFDENSKIELMMFASFGQVLGQSHLVQLHADLDCSLCIVHILFSVDRDIFHPLLQLLDTLLLDEAVKQQSSMMLVR